MDKTLILLKPDAVKRGLVGEILARFEKMGLKVTALKMVWPDKELVGRHYMDDPAYARSVGQKTLAGYAKHGADPREHYGTDDPEAIGQQVREQNVAYLTSGPVVAAILEGHQAVNQVRTTVGHTVPAVSAPGTIRGDYALESTLSAGQRRQSIMNLLHASGSPEEAETEIPLWFTPQERHDYKRVEEYLSE